MGQPATSKTILCLASYDKGYDFIRECHGAGWKVVLLTSESIRDTAHFPAECLDEIFYMPDVQKVWNPEHTLLAVSHLARTRSFERIVALDDFDFEIAALLREHLRVPGMGETTTRYFRDKLATRVAARTEGLLVPDFVHVLNDAKVHEFTERVAAPWVLKPRSMGGSIGIKKVASREELRELTDQLADKLSFYLLEQHILGDVFHVDSVIQNGEIQFESVARYGKPPLDVSHGGDVFTTEIVERGSALERTLSDANRTALRTLKLVRGVSHTEFIRSEADGKLYFLETSARVGGAHVADLVEAATGINLWRAWAQVEMAGEHGTYEPPKPLRSDYAALLVSLAKQVTPDISSFDDPEVVWRLTKASHVGLIVRSADRERVRALSDDYANRIRRDFHAHAQILDRPID